MGDFWGVSLGILPTSVSFKFLESDCSLEGLLMEFSPPPGLAYISDILLDQQSTLGLAFFKKLKSIATLASLIV